MALKQTANLTSHPNMTRIIVSTFVPNHSHLINWGIGDVPNSKVLAQLQLTHKHLRNDGNQIGLPRNIGHGTKVS